MNRHESNRPNPWMHGGDGSWKRVGQLRTRSLAATSRVATSSTHCAIVDPRRGCAFAMTAGERPAGLGKESGCWWVQPPLSRMAIAVRRCTDKLKWVRPEQRASIGFQSPVVRILLATLQAIVSSGWLFSSARPNRGAAAAMVGGTNT
jgi:hypothetical protein